ncbi:MAG: Trk family potassium uptake protein [Dethiobacter sp.]|jgi:trk system potassium uptake protein TrkH|nr:MAG: Trk family potassium uptake protein [Dethiobacter sp.]
MGFFKSINLSPARFLAGGFILMIAAGTFLLSLPFATVTGEISLINALFTATSAVCVTGLVVVDTGTFFTVFGQLVIMFLILGGALGFMTSATLIFVILGKNITLKDRLIIKEALNTDSIQGLVHLIITIAKMAAIAILLGSLFLGFRFFPQLGWKKGLLFSIFHSISAFGNAGFDLFGNFEGLTVYAGDFLVSGTILALFIFGGLGFTVILDIFQRKKPARYSLHSKMVLLFTAFLLISGTLFILFLEFGNPATLGEGEVGSKIFRAFFTAATPRTAGFNVLPTEALKPATLFFLLILMFIGASPASTGGGVKTTTVALMVGTVRALIKGSDEVVFREKRIPSTLILKALTIIFVSLFLIFFMVLAMTIVENKPFLELTFEVFSAFGTVGLSTGITPDLTTTGKTLLIITMYAGRIGPLTMLYALTRKLKPKGVRYPEERILIG